MKAPPVLARALTRSLAPLRGRGAAGLLPRARLAGPMPWVIGVVVALTVLVAGGGLALDNLADRARGELAGSATVQIVDADPQRRMAQAQAAAELLKTDPAVAQVRVVPEEELEALLTPWLGEEAARQGVPIPALVDVALRGEVNDAALVALGDRIAEVAPSARLDAQSGWLAPVMGAIEALQWLVLALIALLAFTGAAAVWLAARNALGGNRETIEIVHLLGGDDRQIAGIFQRSILIDAGLGGALGLASGAAVLLILGNRFAALDSGLVLGGGLDRGDWLILAGIPILAVVIAVLTARATILASLRKML